MNTLNSLLFETNVKDYNSNLQMLLDLINQTSKDSFIVAPEVCLTGFAYDNYEEALEFANTATEAIKKASVDKTIVLTMLEQHDGKVYNFVKIFHNGKVIWKRAKAKLFRFGDEHKYMSEGNSNEVEIVQVNGLKIGVIICFELRFKDYWKKLEGCDIIAVPSWWGVLRTEHFKTLTSALAVMNQCYVVASDSLNEECTKMSGIISPMGEELRNGNKPCLALAYDKQEIKKMRRYMDVGIK